MNQKIEELSKELKNKNIKPSFQRIKVLEYLTVRKNHPTVDEIYNVLSKEIPTLSKATLYNTLDLFRKNALAKIVTIDDNVIRYDATVKNHGHFKCEKCGVIYDFFINVDELETDLDNFKIYEKDVYFRGLCPNCLNINNNNKIQRRKNGRS